MQVVANEVCVEQISVLPGPPSLLAPGPLFAPEICCHESGSPGQRVDVLFRLGQQMRRLNLDRDGGNEGVDLTPMLDVVFILLIFFIVTATFVKELGLDVGSSDQNQNVVDSERKSIVIQITNRDRITIRGRDIDYRAVRANIERLHAEDPEAPVMVQPHPDSTTEVMVHVMDASRQAGIPNISVVSL